MNVSINEKDLSDLSNKVAVITGGASGIGWAAVQVLSRLNVLCMILDRNHPAESLPQHCRFFECDVANWEDLCRVFKSMGYFNRQGQSNRIDIAIANAGVSENTDFLELSTDEQGNFKKPKHSVVAVNYIGTLNFIKLSVAAMREQKTSDSDPITGNGSIVITSSSTGYMPEQRLPIYSSTKAALIMLVRSLRPNLEMSNITINAVAPTATLTPLIHPSFVTALEQAGIPWSTAHTVALAIVYSAISRQPHRAQDYGKEKPRGDSRWNGRVIVPLGSRYTEIEEPLAQLQDSWFGEENMAMMRLQQQVTDTREI